MNNKIRRLLIKVKGRASACRCCVSGLVLAMAAANAPAAVLFEENFADGLGRFADQGRVYTMTAGELAMRGGGSAQTRIRSGPIEVNGAGDLTLSFYRDISGFDSGESLTAAVSGDGSTFRPVRSVSSGSGVVTVDIGDVAGGEDQVYLQFSINASSFFERAGLGSILLEGTASGEPADPEEPDNPDEPENPGGDDEPMPEAGDFVTFESGHVRPMALSPDGNRLYVVNTPDNTVQVYDVSGAEPVAVETIPVGMEPVAVNLRNDGELWVVNHLSDSVSIVDVSGSPARIRNTLLVGDEPRDIEFAGEDDKWAFITAAHRGQNAPFDPELTTPGVGRADVWVYETANPGFQLGGEPVTILNMFGDTLRGLARSPDGSTLYTAVFNSGNRTTVLDEEIPDGGLDKPGPGSATDGTEQPRTGLIVQFDGDNWMGPGDPVRGEEPRSWNEYVKLELPDNDVFEIDATGSVPRVVSRTSGVGTTLFNLAVNPNNGNVYVSNQQANNLTRFEGPGLNSTTVNGNFVQSRITVVDGSNARPRHLNKHIDYTTDPGAGTASERERAVAIPLQMAVTSDGEQLFMASMGSGKLVRYDTGALDSDSFQPDTSDQLVVSGGGATGVVLDEARGRAFVTTRFDNGVSVVDVEGTMNELAHVTMSNPEPEKVVEGRRFLYDATYTSSRGDSSCAGCHVFGDMDHLSWDLGNPDIASKDNPNEYNENVAAIGRNLTFHAMKGPMATQSLRGLKGNGPMHWRGDRTGEDRGPGESLELAAFREFNEAFPGLVGRDTELTDEEMTRFAEFALELTYPPNPVAALDNSLTPELEEALEVYNTVNSDFVTNCNGCHVLDPDRGMFGTDGTMSVEGGDVDEDMKIPHLRNMYQKVGMFAKNGADRPERGEQIRGFGFDNQGASGSVDNFLSAPVFLLLGERRRLLVEQLSLAFPSEMNPIVGQQVTLNPDNRNRSDVQARLDLLIERALVTDPRPECDLVATAVLDGQTRRWAFNANGKFVPGDRATPSLSRSELLDQVSGADNSVTFTCTPPGSGVRNVAGS